jgi:hypothetical protein
MTKSDPSFVIKTKLFPSPVASYTIRPNPLRRQHQLPIPWPWLVAPTELPYGRADAFPIRPDASDAPPRSGEQAGAAALDGLDLDGAPLHAAEARGQLVAVERLAAAGGDGSQAVARVRADVAAHVQRAMLLGLLAVRGEAVGERGARGGGGMRVRRVVVACEVRRSAFFVLGERGGRPVGRPDRRRIGAPGRLTRWRVMLADELDHGLTVLQQTAGRVHGGRCVGSRAR